jgi:hypothetical protein
MSAPHPLRDVTNWREDAPAAEPPLMRIVARTPAATVSPLADADWHLLFEAVLARLRDVAVNPADAATVVPECVQALEWLQGMLDVRRLAPR